MYSTPIEFYNVPPRPRKTRYLAILARLLETFHENGKKFDLSHWCEHLDDDDGNHCGTSACAIGWAMQHPEFNRKGFGMNHMQVPQVYRGPAPTFGNHTTYMQQMEIVEKCRDPNVRYGWNSVMWFFGLSRSEAFWLFIPEHYNGATIGTEGAANVAKRIRSFLKGEQAPPLD